MKRALAFAALAVSACSKAAPPLPLPPPPDATTLSVLEPDGANGCVWKRATPSGEQVLCRLEQPCHAISVQFTDDGRNALASPDPQQISDPRSVCAASGPPRSAAAGPHRQGSFGFDDHDQILFTWQESRLPSLRDRIVARLRHEPLPAPAAILHSAHLTATGWQEDRPAVDASVRAPVSDVVISQTSMLLREPPPAPLLRLVSEALPPAHPEVEWQALMTDPGPSFLQVHGDELTGPLVFLLHGDDPRVAPQSPGESDHVDAEMRGSLVLLQVAGRLGPTYPRLWDAATGELLWSDPKAERAVFWPKP